jgi:glycosyltransferase involved in cell wall biosynthesis
MRTCMRRIKILFVSHSAEMFGAEKCLLDIMANMDRELYEVFLLCPKEGVLNDAAADLGIRTFVVPFRYWLARSRFPYRLLYYLPVNVRGIFKIKKLIEENCIDLIYTNTCTVISAAIASYIAGKPHIWHVHESIGRQTDAFSLMLAKDLVLKIIDGLSKVIIVNSMAIRKIFPDEYGGKIRIIYNSFDVRKYDSCAAERDTIRRRYGISDDVKVISMVGSISNRKGQRNLIEAMPELLRRFPGSRVIIAGASAGPEVNYEAELHRFISDAGMEAHVSFLGFMENVSDIYKMTDLLMVPSKDEPFGRVIVEAMLYGIPVIATKVGGIPEIIEDGVNGALIDSRSPKVIAEAVTAMFNSPEISRRYALEGRKRAANRFDVNNIISQVEEVVQKVVMGCGDTGRV